MIVKADIWMPLYIGDYLADTTRLTTDQHGAYFLLIMDYWRNGAPPDDDLILSNITRMSVPAWRKTKASVLCFFNLIDGFWVQSRIEKELKDANSSKAKAQDKAHKAAAARWGKQCIEDATSNATSNAPSIAQAMHEECPSPSPSPLIKTISSDKPDLPDGFAEFWRQWPSTDRKTGKAPCLNIWKTKKLEGCSASILAHVSAMKSTKKWGDGYEPAPLTFLKQRHWEDGDIDARPVWER